jgi:hypothetical protein
MMASISLPNVLATTVSFPNMVIHKVSRPFYSLCKFILDVVTLPNFIDEQNKPPKREDLLLAL